MVSRSEVSNPLHREQATEGSASRSPELTSSTSASATSAMTSDAATRLWPPAVRREPLLSSSCGSLRAPAAPGSPRREADQRGDDPAEDEDGPVDAGFADPGQPRGAQRNERADRRSSATTIPSQAARWRRAAGSRSAAAAPAAAWSAPSAARKANSARRWTPRASRRLVTLTQAITSTSTHRAEDGAAAPA